MSLLFHDPEWFFSYSEMIENKEIVLKSNITSYLVLFSYGTVVVKYVRCIKVHLSFHMITEISEEKNSRQFEALFNYAAIGIILTNHKGQIINFNKYAETQFGYLKNEVIGKTVEILIPEKYQSRYIEYRNDFHKSPQNRVMVEGMDLYARRKDDVEFPVEISLSHYTINEESYVIAFVIDISVRKGNEIIMQQQKAEVENISTQIKRLNIELDQKVVDRTKMLNETLAELQKSKDELEVVLKKEKDLGDLKSRFVTMASHEFRTPLTAILSSVSLIERYNKQGNSDKIDKHILQIKEEVKNMKDILEDFLSLGHLEENSKKMNMDLIKADEFISEIKKTIYELQQIARPGQKIEFAHNCNNDVKVGTLLKNILVNLISNAIKFSPENSTIHVGCHDDGGDELIITIKDKGIGISEEDQKHLFERFFRAKNAAAFQGTGLGLHIVGRYLELMHGRIDIKSILNEGTTFILYIPQVK